MVERDGKNSTTNSPAIYVPRSRPRNEDKERRRRWRRIRKGDLAAEVGRDRERREREREALLF